MTKIQWTDETWNPVTGCTKVSEGCRNCYAEALFPRVYGRDRVEIPSFGRSRPRRFTDVRCHEDRLDAPLRWRKPRRVFVNSMSDLFHEDVSDEFIAEVLGVCAVASCEFFGRPPGPGSKPQNGPHTFQILTKREVRMERLLNDARFRRLVAQAACRRAQDRVAASWLHDQVMDGPRWPLPNVWLGVSVEDQATADERIPILLDTPAAVRFVSAEPLLSRVDLGLDAWFAPGYDGTRPASEFPDAVQGGLDWIIVGGESGPKARPCDVAWIRSIVEQGKDAGVPVFVKQIQTFRCPTCRCCTTEFPEWPAEECSVCTERARRVRSGNPSEWPEDLRVREFPHDH